MTPQIDVIAAGSPREMGLAQGTALATRILAGRAMLAELEAFRLLKPRWMPYGMFTRSAERRARRLLEGPIRAAMPEAAARVEGIAAGARASLESVYLLNGMEAFMCSLAGRVENSLAEAAAAAASACSAIAIRGRRSATGAPLVARNFDYLPAVRPFYVLRRCHPAGGYRSLEFTAAPLAGAIDGINEHGLAITYNYAYAIDRSPPGPTISMAIASALGACRTVAEAARHIIESPRSGAGILMLADAEEDIASLELSSTASALRRPGEGEDLICHSNSYATPRMQQVEAPASARFTNRVPTPLRGRRVLESSDRRDERLAELLNHDAIFDGDSLAKVLADHGPAGAPTEATLCMHSDYWNTTACVQLLPGSRKMRVSYESACRARFEEFGVE